MSPNSSLSSAHKPHSIAIMQPYIFPYIGYFQLLSAVDTFIIYDDVQYIKGGWINRNRILVGGQPMLFTVPLVAPSPNRKICEIDIDPSLKWKNKLLQTIKQSYARAPYFEPTFSLLERVLDSNSPKTISDLVRLSIAEVVTYLTINVNIIPTSACYGNQHLRSQERVLDICSIEKASDYTNSIGGKVLYNSKDFLREGVNLHFLQPNLSPYRQLNKGEFIPGLSLIDVLMNNSVQEIKKMLLDFKLV
jgi:hypothetical protein